MFTPFNRGIMHDLIEELRKEHRMRVAVEELEMSRYRVRQDGGRWKVYLLLHGNGTVHGVSKFLHITHHDVA